MDLKSLGWKFLNKETFGDGNLSILINLNFWDPYNSSPRQFLPRGMKKKTYISNFLDRSSYNCHKLF